MVSAAGYWRLWPWPWNVLVLAVMLRTYSTQATHKDAAQNTTLQASFSSDPLSSSLETTAASATASLESVATTSSESVTSSLESVTPSGLESVTPTSLESVTALSLESVTPSGLESVTPTSLKSVTSSLESVTPSNLELVMTASLESVTPSNLESVIPTSLQSVTTSSSTEIINGDLATYRWSPTSNTSSPSSHSEGLSLDSTAAKIVIKTASGNAISTSQTTIIMPGLSSEDWTTSTDSVYHGEWKTFASSVVSSSILPSPSSSSSQPVQSSSTFLDNNVAIATSVEHSTESPSNASSITMATTAENNSEWSNNTTSVATVTSEGNSSRTDPAASVTVPDCVSNCTTATVVAGGDDEDSGFEFTTLIIVGIAVGSTAFLLLVCAAILCVAHRCRRRTKQKMSPRNSPSHGPYTGLFDDTITLSYINSIYDHLDVPKDSPDEMMSLESDVYLKSLESTIIANPWVDGSKENARF